MSEDKTSEKKPTVRSSGTLSLGNRSGVSTVKQSFSHGRTNAVVVERKRRRTNPSGSGSDNAEAIKQDQVGAKPPSIAKTATAKTKPTPKATPEVVETTKRDKLTPAQQEARTRALQEAKIRAVEEDKQKALDAERRNEEELKRKAEEEERRRREAEETAAKEAKILAEERATQRTKVVEPRANEKLKQEEESPREAPRSSKAKVNEQKPVKRDNERRQTRLTISKALSSGEERDRSLASFRRRMQREKRRAQGDADRPQQKISRQVTIPETISLQELANRMAERVSDVVKFLFSQGLVHVATDFVDADTAQLIAEEMGHTVKRVAESDVEEGFIGEEDKADQLKPRPPVVTVMGHVDHGKTSLLDSIRNADVVSGEAGGITQHIGAYQVKIPAGHIITFLDTPGHAVFTSMRARGAETTDIVILVVAADDGVKPQTIEAINHARAAKVPLIVAINKIDRPNADPLKVRTELLQHNVQVESMGGDVLEIEVSALKQTNIDKLLEAVHLQAELLELKANPDRSAEGAVIESRMEKGRGSVSTVLIKRGTLRTGDLIVAGGAWGKVRALFNDRGEQIKSAGPATPVEVLGLTGTPNAGESIALVESEQKAREITTYRERRERELTMAKTSNRVSFEQMLARKDGRETKLFTVLIKADTFGSVEAIAGTLNKLGNEEVKVQIVHSGVGGINESDIILAQTTNAAIISFNVRANRQATELASKEGVEIRYYNIIYNMVDDIKLALEGLLRPELRETWLGSAEILEVFSISKVGKVAGCRVVEGTIQRGAHVRLIRDDIVIHEGKLSTLKRFKDEVKEVQPGQECGMGFESYQDIRQGDNIECYLVEETRRKLD